MTPSFTESVLIDLVTDDARSGFMFRLARHVDEQVAWLWLVTFGPEGVHGFVDDSIPIPPTRTADDRGSAVYEVTPAPAHPGTAQISRRGPADAITDGTCRVEVLGHATSDVPRGAGPVRLCVEATFQPRSRSAGSNLAGRSESIVEVEATVTVGGHRRTLSGLGQFHEQHQDVPRFDTPFTYASLRGARTGLIGLRVPAAGRAVVYRDGEVTNHAGFHVAALDRAAPGSRRPLGIDGGLSGWVAATVTYSLPIHAGRRPSAIVAGEIDGEHVTGFLNDWLPGA